MKSKNAIFQEEFNFTFTDKKSILNIVFNMLALAVISYLSSPLYDTSYYFRQGVQPLCAASTSIASFLFLLLIIIRKETLMLDNKQVTSMKNWVHRSPLTERQIIFPNILFALWFSFFLISLAFPLLIIGFTTSGAGTGSMLICIAFLFLFTFIFQIISLVFRYLSDNQGVYIAFWIILLLVLVVAFSIFSKSNPFSTISGFFSPDRELYPPFLVFGRKLPFYTRGIIAAAIMLTVSLTVFRIQLAVGKKEGRK